MKIDALGQRITNYSSTSTPSEVHHDNNSNDARTRYILGFAISVPILLFIVTAYFVFRHNAIKKYGPTRGQEPLPNASRGASTRRVMRGLGWKPKSSPPMCHTEPQCEVCYRAGMLPQSRFDGDAESITKPRPVQTVSEARSETDSGAALPTYEAATRTDASHLV